MSLQSPIHRQTTEVPQKTIYSYKNYFSSKDQYLEVYEERSVKITEKDLRNMRRLERKRKEKNHIKGILLGLEKAILHAIPREGDITPAILKKSIRSQSKMYMTNVLESLKKQW